LKDASANDRKVRGIIQNLLRDFPQTVTRCNPPGTVSGADHAMLWLDVMNQWRESTTPDQCLAWADQLLTGLQVRRSVQLEKPVSGLYQIHYHHDDGRNVYFFANTGQTDVAVRVVLPLAGKRVERWNPENGSRGAFSVDKGGRVLVALPVAGSLLLVAGEGDASPVSDLPLPPKMLAVQEITGPWSATFQPANGAAFEITPFTPADLQQSQDPRLNRFAGRVIYRTQFKWDKSPAAAAQLDLGEVANCITEVTLNGRALGVRWYGRNTYALDTALKQGLNELEVTAVTMLFNNVRKKNEAALPSGLIGPVTLQTK
jgi:hypothetical protein